MGKEKSCRAQLSYAKPLHTQKEKASKPSVAESKAFRCQPGKKSQQAPQKRKCTAKQFLIGTSMGPQQGLRTGCGTLCFCTGFGAVLDQVAKAPFRQ